MTFAQVMSKPVDVPYTKADVLRAFKIFADEGAPPGCISADTLEKAVVSAGLGVRHHLASHLLKQACVSPPLGVHYHPGLGAQWGVRQKWWICSSVVRHLMLMSLDSFSLGSRLACCGIDMSHQQLYLIHTYLSITISQPVQVGQQHSSNSRLPDLPDQELQSSCTLCRSHNAHPAPAWKEVQ